MTTKSKINLTGIHEQTSRERASATIAKISSEQSRSATPDQLQEGLLLIEEWFIGKTPTKEREDRAVRLARTLIFDFSEFHEELLQAFGEDSPMRQLSGELLKSGRVTSRTTFAELADMLEIIR